METIERKTTAELLDELITINLKIWHLVDKGYAGDGESAVLAQRLNQKRGELMRALNKRLDPSANELAAKVYS